MDNIPSTFLVSQVLAGGAILLDIISGQCRDRKKILACMLCAGVVNGTHFYLLGAQTATLISFLFCIRVAVAYKFPWPYLSMIFILVAVVSTSFNWNGINSCMALGGNSLGAVATFQKNTYTMRCIFIAASILWTVHNILIGSPVAVAAEVAFISTHAIGIWRYERSSSKAH